jgi:outer membrane receptor protein involved in Fe transport
MLYPSGSLCMKLKYCVTVVLLAIISVTPVLAQAVAGTGAMSGVVRDASGATVPGAQVIVANDDMGIRRTIETNSAGVFTAPALVPAAGYSVRITKEGFAPYEAKDLEIAVGQNLSLNVTLAVGATQQQVEVVASAPLVEQTKTDVSGVVNNRAIQDLPINGRRVDSFVLLTPGVSNDGNYGLLSFRGTAGGNSFLVDGTDTTEQYYNENAGRTRIAAQISQDAVQEFQVVSANYSAEYGRAMGGVVNTVTKSGSNELHGTAYYFFRNKDFNARDPFSTYVPADKRQQIGGSLGGAIKKDKLFYFVNTEVTRRDFPISSSLNTVAVDPNTKTWKGCTPTKTAGDGLPTQAQCDAINKLLPRFYGQIPRQLNQELYFGKLDYHLNDSNTLSASFNFLHALSPNGIQTAAALTTGTALTSNGNDAVTVKNGRLLWTSVPTSNFVNEARFGIAGDRQADVFNDSLLGGGLGYLALTVNSTSIGATNYLPRVLPSEMRYQWQDNATWTKGSHTIKFGADIANTEDYSYYISNYNGSYTYQTVNNFALDYSGNTTGAKHWQSYSQTFGNPVSDFTIRDFGFYLQDQWRATKRLTVNYGARYEYEQLPQPSTCNPDYPLTCHLHSSPTNLAPRIGLAYQLDDKTVLQAGYGMFYARFQGGTISNLFTTGNGKVQTGISLSATQSAQLAAGPVFPNILSAIPAGASVSAVNLQEMDPNIKTPYSEQGNIGIQRQLSSDIALNVSYIWSRGIQLYGSRDLNLPTGRTNFTYTITDANGNPTGTYTTPVVIGARPDTRYGSITYDENGVNSYYNALAVQLNKRFSHGLQGMLSYTWSHEIDDGQSYGGSSNSLFLTGTSYWLNNGDYKGDKGSGTLDQRHRLVLSWVWAPTVKADSRIVNALANHWQLSSISTLASGHPYGTLQVYLNDKPVSGMLGYSLNGTGFSYRAPWLPVNSYYLPAMYRSDARLSRIIPIHGEQYKLYLNLEMFNIANTWSATGYTSSRAYLESKGVITAAPQNLYIPSAAYGSPDGTQARRLQVSARFVF